MVFSVVLRKAAFVLLLTGCGGAYEPPVPPDGAEPTSADSPTTERAAVSAAELRSQAKAQGTADGITDSSAYTQALVKFVRGTACTYGLSISIELIGAPDTAEMEKHARICNELYAPLPNENTQSRARFMAKERELISAGARTAELGLERMSLYVAAYGSAWKSVDLHAIAGSAWTQGCNDAVLAASGKAPPPAKLRETCESSTKVDLFSPAIDFVIVESGQER